MKKYHVRSWDEAKIIEVEVDRETDSFVYLKGRREAKHSHGYHYFDLWIEAWAYWNKKVQTEITAKEKDLVRLRELLHKLEAMCDGR